MRTYSRQRHRTYQDDPAALEPPTKRARLSSRTPEPDNLDATASSPRPSSTTMPSSSPSQRRIYSSDQVSTPSTPPSSPPASSATQTFIPRKATFSFLKRKSTQKTKRRPLGETTGNAHKSSLTGKQPQLTQLRLDLGQSLTKECKICRMSYRPSDKEDSAAHRRYHEMATAPKYVEKEFAPYTWGFDPREATRVVWAQLGDYIIRISRGSSNKVKHCAAGCLQPVHDSLGLPHHLEDLLNGDNWPRYNPTTEPREQLLPAIGPFLGEPPQEQRPPDWKGKAVAYDHDRPVLSSLDSNKVGESSRSNLKHYIPPTETSSNKAQKTRHRRREFKLYLYVRDGRCVGICLVEKIRHAYKTYLVDGRKDILKYDHNYPCVAELGINRIWVHDYFQRQGLATLLVDTARKEFYHGYTVPKDMVAFTQTTTQGTPFARAYCERFDGWMQYNNEEDDLTTLPSSRVQTAPDPPSDENSAPTPPIASPEEKQADPEKTDSAQNSPSAQSFAPTPSIGSPEKEQARPEKKDSVYRKP